MFQARRGPADMAARPKRPFRHSLPRNPIEELLLAKYERDLARWRALPREVDAQFERLRAQINEAEEGRILAAAMRETERRRKLIMKRTLRQMR